MSDTDTTTAAVTTEQVWAALHDDIRRFVQRRVRRDADVDDIVQRVFMQVHRALPSLRDVDRLHAWIYQATRRAIVDHYRSPVLRREVAGGDASDVVADVLPAVPADEDEPSVLQSLAACLHPLIGQLTPADQQALQLVELEGVTQAEAAARLGLSVSGMKSRVQRARTRLKAAVEACCRVELDRRGGLRFVRAAAATRVRLRPCRVNHSRSDFTVQITPGVICRAAGGTVYAPRARTSATAGPEVLTGAG